jgi:hypothetical protein
VENETQLKRILTEMEGKKTVGEIQYQHMAFDKVYKYFNWKPSHDINSGIKKSIIWFKKYLEAQQSN